ncbi:Allophanate hydrolase subunit 2 [Kitasatospora sp. MMS16-BH015]|uniref:5-oxoprolinase subunit C family protein n=1 Tax=Kitasatospora sp. MMS16-BH015 TaxID=2018025 RepID=UPI000CA1D977|nr:biotin-dependent carboxyltransferase family protein [Kitasatospora sp. MMS16-BH015]AUG76473.1 Allophanate hydrolase subunit 2 [Kitasatospora sp. MMS16-BH015]
MTALRTGRTVRVLQPGYGATVQDLGRPGHGALGVSPSGAADPDSLRLANRLVGNEESAAALECLLGGLVLAFDHHATVALTGAPCPARAGGRPVGPNAPVRLAPGEQLRLGTATDGLRVYVAVRGGLDTPAVLGSRSTDTLSGLGPERLAAGGLLPVGDRTTGWPAVDLAPRRALPAEPLLRILPGPRDDWFTPAALAALCAAPYTVTEQSDRIGMRLAGPALERVRPGELPSEGTVAGALQVPPSGRPILFLADHPVTGGYPVIAVVHEDDLPLAAQTRPGRTLRFRLAQRPGAPGTATDSPSPVASPRRKIR